VAVLLAVMSSVSACQEPQNQTVSLKWYLVSSQGTGLVIQVEHGPTTRLDGYALMESPAQVQIEARGLLSNSTAPRITLLQATRMTIHLTRPLGPRALVHAPVTTGVPVGSMHS